MRVLVTGGRAYQDREHVFRRLDKLHAGRTIAVVIHGACCAKDRSPWRSCSRCGQLSQEPCHQHRRAYPRVSVPLLCKGQSFGCRRIDESEFPLTTLRIRGDESWRIEVEDESSDDREEQANGV